MQRVIRIGLQFFLLMGLCSCSFQFSDSRPKIRIGLIAPLSGEFAETTGKATVAAAEIAVHEINQKGGLRVEGKPQQVLLLVEDDQDDPNQAIAAARKLIFQDKVVAIVGLPVSRIAIPVSEFLEQSRLPTISTQSTNPQTTAGKKYIFRMCFVDSFQGTVMANFVREELGANRAAVLYDVASAYNRGLAEVFQKRFTELGGEVVAFETYTTDANQDFTSQLTRIKANQPDILFLPNYTIDLETQLHQIQKLGIQSTLIGGDSWENLQIADYPQIKEGFYSSPWHPNQSNPEVKAFLEAYQQKHHKPANPSAALTYDALHLLFQAIATQGQADPESIRQGLSKIQSYQGIAGLAKFNGTGDPLKSVAIMQIKNGKPVFYKEVKP